MARSGCSRTPRGSASSSDTATPPTACCSSSRAKSRLDPISFATARPWRTSRAIWSPFCCERDGGSSRFRPTGVQGATAGNGRASRSGDAGGPTTRPCPGIRTAAADEALVDIRNQEATENTEAWYFLVSSQHRLFDRHRPIDVFRFHYEIEPVGLFGDVHRVLPRAAHVDGIDDHAPAVGA